MDLGDPARPHWAAAHYFRTDVYVVNADGGGLRRLGPGIAGSWSPDGSRILYAERYPGRLFVMSPDGSGKRAVPGAVGADPHWR